MTNDFDEQLRRWREETVPWARELAIGLGADETDVSMVTVEAEWLGGFDDDWGHIPGCKFRFRVGSRRDYETDERYFELTEARFRMDFDSYDVIYTNHIPIGKKAPFNFLTFLEETPSIHSATVPIDKSPADWIKIVQQLPFSQQLAQFYHLFIERVYDIPTPEEEMHTMTGWNESLIKGDESIIEAGEAAIKGEIWKGELLELMKGLRGEPGWDERLDPAWEHGSTDVSWYPEGHLNYYMYLQISKTEPPKFIVFVDPWLRGNTTGWRAERYLRNYKQVIGLPKSLQAWVMSDVEKIETGGGTNSYTYDVMKEVAARGVPHDIERAYQRMRQVLIPAVEPEEMHTMTSWNESAKPLSEFRRYRSRNRITDDLADPLYLFEHPVDYKVSPSPHAYDLGTFKLYSFFTAFAPFGSEEPPPPPTPENIRVIIGFEFTYGPWVQPERKPKIYYSFAYLQRRLATVIQYNWRFLPFWNEWLPIRQRGNRGLLAFINEYNLTTEASYRWQNISVETRGKIVALIDECLEKYTGAIFNGLRAKAPEIAALLLPPPEEEMHTMTGWNESK